MTRLTAIVIGDAETVQLCAENPLLDVLANGAGARAAAIVAERRPAVAFLDLSAPGMDAQTFARLRNAGGPELVILSTRASDAATAFELDAADFLLKPASAKRLEAALGRVRDRLEARALRGDAPCAAPPAERLVWVRAHNGHVALPLEQIDWVEAQRDYVSIHVGPRSYLMRSSLAAIQERLPAADVLRVHRSTLVRRAAIQSVRRDRRGRLELVLVGGAVVRVGAAYAFATARALGLPRRKPRSRASVRSRQGEKPPPTDVDGFLMAALHAGGGRFGAPALDSAA